MRTNSLQAELQPLLQQAYILSARTHQDTLSPRAAVEAAKEAQQLKEKIINIVNQQEFLRLCYNDQRVSLWLRGKLW